MWLYFAPKCGAKVFKRMFSKCHCFKSWYGKFLKAGVYLNLNEVLRGLKKG